MVAEVKLNLNYLDWITLKSIYYSTFCHANAFVVQIFIIQFFIHYSTAAIYIRYAVNISYWFYWNELLTNGHAGPKLCDFVGENLRSYYIRLSGICQERRALLSKHILIRKYAWLKWLLMICLMRNNRKSFVPVKSTYMALNLEESTWQSTSRCLVA